MPEYPPDNLFQYRKIHPWLYERGLSKDVIVDMQVGYDDNHCGIIFPHFYMGKLVGWQTRHLVEKDNRFACPTCQEKKVPKYKNTSDFPKMTTLYNYDNVLHGGFADVVVVESPMSALYLMSHGCPNVVAHFGSPIKEEQCNLLVRFRRVLYWPDNDDAGRNSVFAAFNHLWRYTDVQVVPVLPGEKADPANAKPEEINVYLEHAYPGTLLQMTGLATLEEVAQLNIGGKR